MRLPQLSLLFSAAVVFAACGPSVTQTGDQDGGQSVCDPCQSGGGDGGNGGGGGNDGGSTDGGGGGGDGGSGALTWYRDVLPITQVSCQGCHVNGGIAPFSLETYAQAQPMALAMANAVQTKQMPPWKPDPACNSYQNERRLTQAQIDTIVTWAESGAAEGDPNDAPPPPMAQPGLEWVDSTLDTGVDYTPSTSAGPDDYHCFVVDLGLTSTKDVIGFDINPGTRKEVHHVLLYSANATDAANKDASTPEPGWTCFGGPGTPNPMVVGAWAPGSPATEFPTGTGIRLSAGTVLVMQVHYNTSSAAPSPDRTQVKLQYAKSPVAKQAYIVPQAQTSFLIPPMSQNYSVTDTEDPAPLSLKVYGVMPHMHTLGKHIKVTDTAGDCLVDIPEWDFHWQQLYFFKTPISYSAGTQRQMTCTWDNPTNNSITWGEGTSDEMCLNYVYVTL